MTIGEYLYIYDRNTYERLKTIGKRQKKNNIELGDSIENLMRHDSYRRQGRRIRQTKRGG